MPSPLKASVAPKETQTADSDATKAFANDSDALKSQESNQKKKQQPPQLVSFNGSPRRKFQNRQMNGNTHNRNNSVNKRTTNDTNNNSNAKQLSYRAPSTQPKDAHREYQHHHNGHMDQSKASNHRARSITKSNYQNQDYFQSSQKSSPPDPSAMKNPNFEAYSGDPGRNGHPQKNAGDVESAPRKYSLDFLHQVGHKMTNVGLVQQQYSPKTTKHQDDVNLMALKVALGDNSGNYNHFYSSGMYGNHIMLQQQQQYQQQNYSRYQPSHQQVQRAPQFSQQDNFHRMFKPPMYHDQEPKSLPCHCPQPVQQQMQRSFQPSYNNSPSYQNRNKNERRDFRDNTKKHRHGYGFQNGGNSDRNGFKSNKDNRYGQLGKSHSFNDDDSGKRKDVEHPRNNAVELAYRSLSPTPPTSSKSSSPGAQDKDLLSTTESNYELVDDSASTASVSSSNPSGSASLVSEMKISSSAPILLAPDEPLNVNVWIDNNFGSALNNGLSVSAEHLNMREVPIKIIKRPPSSSNGSNRRNFHPIPRNFPTYDPQSPFDYYLARAEDSEMRVMPPSLRCGSIWDNLSVDMWERFQGFQQSCSTYQSKMIIWRDLFNAMKVKLVNFLLLSPSHLHFPTFQSCPMFQQNLYSKWGLYLVGSTISGFGCDSSDIDMCLVTKVSYSERFDPRMEAMVTLNDLKNYLTSARSKILSFLDGSSVFTAVSQVHSKASFLSTRRFRFCVSATRRTPSRWT